MNTEIDFDTYAKNMRLTFSNKEMITESGNINHKYFLVKKGAYWSTKEDEALIRGLELFGVGKWKKIKFYELTTHNEYELELRACILLGVQNLDQYANRKLKRQEINQIRQKNGLYAI